MKTLELSSTPVITEQFLKIVGSPFVNAQENFDFEQFSPQFSLRFYDYARKNRMSLLYLEAIKNLNELGSLQKDYNSLIIKYSKINDVICRVCQMLNKTGVNYTLFKSVRPYQEVTVDIDVLVFGSINEYERVIHAMNGANYEFLGGGPLSLTFRDREGGIGLDIYYEVGVSHIIYMDKNVLEHHICERELPNNEFVRSLSHAADLLAIIAHSVVKEHMYVLSEYYTTLYYLEDMDEEALQVFVSLVNICKLRLAAKTHLGISALLHFNAHGFLPGPLLRLLEILEVNPLELSRVEQMKFAIPHKFHPITILRALVEKFGEKKARKSLAFQFFRLLNPQFTLSFIEDVLNHIFRESY